MFIRVEKGDVLYIEDMNGKDYDCSFNEKTQKLELEEVEWMVTSKECWKISGYQFARRWTKDYGDMKTFEHFLWSMDFETAKQYIDNLFEDIHARSDKEWYK